MMTEGVGEEEEAGVEGTGIAAGVAEASQGGETLAGPGLVSHSLAGVGVADVEDDVANGMIRYAVSRFDVYDC